MEQYFSKQPKVINGVPQKLYFMLEEHKGIDGETGGTLVKVSVMSMLENEMTEFSETHEFVRAGTDAMAVFKIKE